MNTYLSSIEWFGFRVLAFKFRVSGFGFGDSGFGVRVSGFGCRVQVLDHASPGLREIIQKMKFNHSTPEI